MSDDDDLDLEPVHEEPPAAEVAVRRNVAAWWIAAAAALAAVAVGAYLLSGVRPSPGTLQAAATRSRAEAQIDDAAYGAQLAAAHAAKFAQDAAATHARATEAAARQGAASANATAVDAATTAPAEAAPQ
jgi:hypothetical protein